MKILQEEQHSTLAIAHDEIAKNCQNILITTRSAACGELTSVYETLLVYHGSFLPRTKRDTRTNLD